MIDNERKLFDVLTTLLPTLRWLNTAQPIDIQNIPTQHIEALKQLDALGFVFKRNSRTYGLQKERLKKVIKRAPRYADSSSQPLEQLFDKPQLALSSATISSAACEERPD